MGSYFLKNTDRGPFRLTSNILYPLTGLKQKVGFVTFQEFPNELTHWEEWVVLPTSYLHTGTHILAAGSTGFWSLTAVCQPPLFLAERVVSTIFLATSCLECRLHFPMPLEILSTLKVCVGVSSRSKEDCCFCLFPEYVPQCV